MKRCAEFLRSVLPADLTQLIFLCGVVSLFVSSQLRWFSTTITIGVRGPLAVIFLATFGIQFAAAAGYFLCFRSGGRPARSSFCWVCLPALIGLLARCGLQAYVFILLTFDYLNGKPFLTYMAGAAGVTIGAIENLGPGFHFALLGLVLVSLFLWRATTSSSSLPLALPMSSISDSDDHQSWYRWHLLIWILLFWMPFGWCGFALFSLVRHLYPTADLSSQNWLTSALLHSIFLPIFVALAVWIDGQETWAAFRRHLRLPAPESFLLSIGLPLVAVFLGSMAYYPVALGRSALRSPGVSDPASFSGYFALPAIASISSLLLPAFFEEAIFRGLLQPRFVRRFGVARGIFLVSLVWAAWHFAGDFTQRTDLGALEQFSIRLPLCVSMGMVLGWLTLRTGSILPAILAHAIFNAFVELSSRGFGLVRDWLIYGSWGLLAYILFRYWPVHADAARQHSAQPATTVNDPN